MTEFAMLRRFYNIDPLSLTVRQYDGYLSRISELISNESGETNHLIRVHTLRGRQLEAD